jgi:hypothetical protein
MMALPKPSTATQKLLVGHEADASPPPDQRGSMGSEADQDLPFQVTTLSERSTTVQKEVVGHETEEGPSLA